jgi:hypothetical protein
MRARVFPVFVEENGQRISSGLRALRTEEPAVLALRLRERGWDPYKVSFDREALVWVACVFEKKDQRALAS